jgi:hypothetical protein
LPHDAIQKSFANHGLPFSSDIRVFLSGAVKAGSVLRMDVVGTFS